MLRQSKDCYAFSFKWTLFISSLMLCCSLKSVLLKWSFLGMLLKCTSFSLLHTTHTRENSLQLYAHNTSYVTLWTYFQKCPLLLAGKFWKVGSPHFFSCNQDKFPNFCRQVSHRNGLKSASKASCKTDLYFDVTISLLKTQKCRPPSIHALEDFSQWHPVHSGQWCSAQELLFSLATTPLEHFPVSW